MRILILVDKYESAIDRLSQPIKKFNPHLNIDVLSLHPKRPNPQEVETVRVAWEKADIVQVAYWRSGEKFKELFPELFKSKKKILCHYNPYDIRQRDWYDYEKIIVGNDTIHSKMPYAVNIPYAIDLDFFKFNDEYTKEKTVIMVVARIEGKKGVREVAEACKALDYKFILVGRISSRDYFDQIMEANPETDFREDITDTELRNAYYESAVHICNSIDDFESGTLPILESMATGVIVLTRNVGHVPDLYNGSNMVIRAGEQHDVQDLINELRDLMDNTVLRQDMREKAWDTVKIRTLPKMAKQFEKVYYKVRNDRPLVSIITPTFNNPEVLLTSLEHSVLQDYPNVEIVVVDSGNVSVEPLIKAFRETTEVPVKYIYFENNGEYTLPKARNKAVIEAIGEYVCFCDERVAMNSDAISEFMVKAETGVWLYGVKDNVEKAFVENFSLVYRKQLIAGGMFNERVNCYGGASQEIRTRYGELGCMFERVDAAHAKQIASSKSRWNKRDSIIKAKQILWELYEKV